MLREFYKDLKKESLINMLDKQAKEDLELYYNDINPNNTNKKEIFWDILSCAGCEEEFKEYLNKKELE